MSNELRRQLSAFGQTLEAATPDRIRPTEDSNSEDGLRARSWMGMLGAAAAIAVVIVGLSALSKGRQAGPASSIPATTTLASAETTAAPSQPSTTRATDTVADMSPAFTPLLLTEPPVGFALDTATYEPGPGGTGVARYVSPGNAAQLEIINRNDPDRGTELTEAGRSFYRVDDVPGFADGLIVVADGEGDGECLPEVCSIGVQWDDRTYTSLRWVASDDGVLGPEASIDSLLELVPRLDEDEASWVPTTDHSSVVPSEFSTLVDQARQVVGDIHIGDSCDDFPARDPAEMAYLFVLPVVDTTPGNCRMLGWVYSRPLLLQAQDAIVWQNHPGATAIFDDDGNVIGDADSGEPPE